MPGCEKCSVADEQQLCECVIRYIASKNAELYQRLASNEAASECGCCNIECDDCYPPPSSSGAIGASAMAVEIISRGTPPQEKPLRGRCYTCGTVVKCKLSDATATNDSVRNEPTVYHVKCPVCSEHRLYVNPIVEQRYDGGLYGK
jgi:hypothetical protein